MEDIKDIDGNDVDINKILTIVAVVAVTGSKGTVRWFRPWKQYMFDETERQYTPLEGCGDTFGKISMIHYRVTIDDEYFWIPEERMAIEGMLRPEWRQDKYAYLEHISDEPKDFKKVYKDLTGIDLDKRLQPEHNGYDYGLELKRQQSRNKGKKYGEVETDGSTTSTDNN